TDTAAALRAAEMNCEAMLKGTQVDGVYSADPKTDPDAVRYETLAYQDVLARDLRVMDASAVSLMRDTNIPIVVFSLHNKGALQDVLKGEGPSTVISAE
ncbi:MAG: UMP kinase, partial [Pseudomonadota bacterium]